MIEVKIDQAMRMVEKYLKQGLVPMVTSSPGLGKSYGIREIAKKFNLKLIDFRLGQANPNDILGFPGVKDGRGSYFPMDFFPLENDPIPEGYSGWMLFFDEITSAQKDVQAAAYQVIQDHAVGHHKLHKNVAVCAAGNIATDGAIVEEMSTALQSKMVHIRMVVDSAKWVTWGNEKGLDHRITSFIEFDPRHISNFDPEHTEETFACPRTWEYADKVLKEVDMQDPDFVPMLAGTISEGMARLFYGHCQIVDDLPKFDKIIANPSGIAMPQKKQIMLALAGSISSNVKYDNMDLVMKFVKRMDIEFQVTTLRHSLKRSPALTAHPAVLDWITTSGHTLF